MQKHPRNQHFEWQRRTGPCTFLNDDTAASYDRDGYFLLEDAFTPAEVDEVIQAIDPIEARVEKALRDQGGEYRIARADSITFSIHLVKLSETLKAFSRHPVFQGICRDIIGPGARLYWDQAVYKKPGTPEEFPWHQDNGYGFVEPQQYLTCWVALTDATIANGCPWVVPGLHKEGTLKHELGRLGYECISNPENAVAVPARAGSVVVFSSLTPHRTGPNLTDQTRRAYILQYAPDGARKWPDLDLDGESGEPALQCDPDRQYYVDAAG